MARFRWAMKNKHQPFLRLERMYSWEVYIQEKYHGGLLLLVGEQNKGNEVLQ